MTNTAPTPWYNRKWLVILLCFLFFPVGLYGLWKSEVFSGGWKVGLTIIIVLLVVGNIAGRMGNTGDGSASQNTSYSSKNTWVKVAELKGSGMKKGQSFHLQGNDCRVIYEYKGTSGLGMGVFNVYVMDKGKDMMKDGAIPEVMSTNETEQGESSVTRSAGEYYLAVNGAGNWSVTIEEMR